MSVSFSLLQALGLGERIMTRMSHAMDPAIGSFDPAFYRDNFVGQGNCGGSKQTPIQLPSGFISALGEERFTSFNMPKVRGAKIVNRGTGVEINWDPLQFDLTKDDFPVVQVAAGATGVASSLENYNPAAPDPVVRTLKMVPVNLHWHVVSEHTVGGTYAALEAHIVTFVGPNQATEWGCDSMWEMNGTPNLENCVAVFGMMYDIGPSTPHWLQTTVNTAAAGRLRFVDDTAPFPGTLDLNAVLPQTKSHFTYPGSLTTPPCAETLLWHVFNEALTITAEAKTALEQIIAQTSTSSNPNIKNDYRHNNRPLQPLRDRTIFFAHTK